MSLSLSFLDIKSQLQACKSKEDTFKTLVTLSKTLPRLSTEEKIEQHKVKGCESAVWLLVDERNNVRTYKADSDAKLMRGVLVILLSLVQNQSTQSIQSLDLVTELASLKLDSYLTHSRTNGVLALINKIQS